MKLTVQLATNGKASLINCAVFPQVSDHRTTPLTEDMHHHCLHYIAIAVKCEQPTACRVQDATIPRVLYLKLQQLAKNTKEASTLESVNKWTFFANGLELYI